MIDLYCERTAPGLWGEPVNLLTSAAYLVAAWALIGTLRGRVGITSADRLLAWLPLAIAIGSASFHAFASPWSRRLDEAPILLFQLLFLWTYGRRMTRIPRRHAGVLLAVFVVAVTAGRMANGVLNGSLAYVPAVAAAAVVAGWHAYARASDRFVPLLGACIFAIAVMFRMIDNDICGRFPTGTHFVWHALTAWTVYLFARTLIRSNESVQIAAIRL